MTPSFADFLNEDTRHQMNQQQYPVGSVFVAEFDRSHGIIPKGDDTSRNKMFIILGHDKKGGLLGSVIINTDPTKHNQTEEFINLQYPLPRHHYDTFLDHTSYVNCAEIFIINPNTLKRSRHLGTISEDHLEYIIDAVKSSETITPKILRQFALID